MKDAIFAKLEEVEAMLQSATVDGEKLTETEAYTELQYALSRLTEAVDYYLD